MTRFARAKGSKSSNERLPLESTPWHVMKQQLEAALDREEQQVTKTKSAKQLLQEKEDVHYPQSLGNTNTEWAEFDHAKTKVNKVEHSGKVSKKPKGENKKLKKAFIKSVTEENIADATDIKEEPILIPLKNKDKLKEKKLKHDQKNTTNDFTNCSKLEEKAINEKTKKKKKQKAEKSDSGLSENKTKQVNNESIDSTSVQFKDKKRKSKAKSESKNATQNANDDQQNLISESTSECKPVEKIIIMSKRQKRNLKQQNKKIEDKNEGVDDTISNERNDGNKKRKFEDKRINKFADSSSSNNGERRNNSNYDKKSLDRFGGSIPRKYQTKVAKVRDDKEHKRRKPDNAAVKMTINGMDVEVVKYDGFPIKKEDAARLTALRKQMVMKGIPKSDIDAAMKLERRRCEKALARIRKQVCFHCRKAGHNLSDCPELGQEEVGTGICFKCGSTEHTHFECKVTKTDDYRYAKCFICREQGHVARQCPDNPKGLYPDGGSCKICGDVTHLKKDCPDLLKEKEETAITLTTINDKNLEALDNETVKIEPRVKPNKKVVKF